DDVVSESFTQLYGDGPLVIDEDEVIRILRTTPHEKAVRTPDQLERMSKILNSVEEESKRVTERVNVSGNMDEYLN
ncbi:MAG: hypothetical protein QF878_10600, partial [SAR202 cluster bacterium]|nr:hypothetical protein [SAR202 cluster bacterium]